MYICLIWGPVFCHQTSPGCFCRGTETYQVTFFSQQERELPGIPGSWAPVIWRAIGVLGKKSQVSKNIMGNWFSKSQVSKISIQNQQVLEKNHQQKWCLNEKKGSMEFKWIDAFEAPPRSLFQNYEDVSHSWYSMYLFLFAEVAEQFGLPPPNHPVFSSSVESSLLKTPWLCFFLC